MTSKKRTLAMMQDEQYDEMKSRYELNSIEPANIAIAAQDKSLTYTPQAQQLPVRQYTSTSLNPFEEADEPWEQTKQAPEDELTEAQQNEKVGNQDQDDVPQNYHQLYFDIKVQLEQTQQSLQDQLKETQRSLQESIQRQNQLVEDVQNWAQRCSELEKAMQSMQRQSCFSTASSSRTDPKEKQVDNECNENEKDLGENLTMSAGSNDQKGEQGSQALSTGGNYTTGDSESTPSPSQKHGSTSPSNKTHNETSQEILDDTYELSIEESKKGDQKWMEMFKKLLDYKHQHGHCNVPRKYVDKQLGKWVNTQRHSYRSKTKKIPAKRVQRLESIGFLWTVRINSDPSGPSARKIAAKMSSDQKWDEKFKKLQSFKEQHGHCNVPRSYEDKSLARWVSTQRSLESTNFLDADRIKQLESIGFSWWVQKGTPSPKQTSTKIKKTDQHWDEMFTRLQTFWTQNHHTNVPRSYKDKQLARWVNTQRTSYIQKTLTDDRTKRLKSIGFVWCPQKNSNDKSANELSATQIAANIKSDQRWMENFNELKEFQEKNGHCNVRRSYTNKSLGHWVNTQRTSYNQKTLAADRINRLESIGLIWNLRKYVDTAVTSSKQSSPKITSDQKWEDMFGKLQNFKEQNGHCNVPRIFSFLQLEDWVNKQRNLYNSNRLAAEKINRLESIGFVWCLEENSDNHPIESKLKTTQRWEEMFERLRDFKEQNGHCNVQRKHTDKQLGTWVNTQRTKYSSKTLTAERAEMLEAIGFIWNVRKYADNATAVPSPKQTLEKMEGD